MSKEIAVQVGLERERPVIMISPLQYRFPQFPYFAGIFAWQTQRIGELASCVLEFGTHVPSERNMFSGSVGALTFHEV